MAEREVSPARLESISDGVIAVIITIMVLELRPPHDARPQALLQLWPGFLSYLISFVFVAIYWVNHRYLFRHLRAVDDRILWSNMALLFVLSLIPFGAAYMGQNGLPPFAVAFDAGIMASCGLAFWALRSAIAQHIHDPDELATFNYGRAKVINAVAVATYALAIPAAYIHPLLSLAMNLAISILYMTPLARPDRAA